MWMAYIAVIVAECLQTGGLARQPARQAATSKTNANRSTRNAAPRSLAPTASPKLLALAGAGREICDSPSSDNPVYGHGAAFQGTHLPVKQKSSRAGHPVEDLST